MQTERNPMQLSGVRSEGAKLFERVRHYPFGVGRLYPDQSCCLFDRQSQPAVLFSKFLVFSFDFRAPGRVAVIIRTIGSFSTDRGLPYWS